MRPLEAGQPRRHRQKHARQRRSPLPCDVPYGDRIAHAWRRLPQIASASATMPGKFASALLSNSVAPEPVVHARAGVEVVGPRRRELPRLGDRSRQAILLREQVIGEEHRRQQQRGNPGRNDQQGSDTPASRPNPLFDTHRSRTRRAPTPRRSARRSTRTPGTRPPRRAEPHASRVPLLEQPIECEQRQRQELQMLRLDVRQPHERLRVERGNRSADDRGRTGCRSSAGRAGRPPIRSARSRRAARGCRPGPAIRPAE